MSGIPLDRPEFERWRAEANRALDSARREADAAAHNWACFLAEQSAQLAVKALLHGLGLGPWGHDLDRLGGAVAEAGIEMPTEIWSAMTRLGRHYIPARYPDAHASGPASVHYRDTDAAQAIADAKTILSAIDRAWEGLIGD